MKYSLLFIACFIVLNSFNKTHAQTEVEAWGNLKGIRVDGQLFNLESSIDVISNNGSTITATAKEAQRPQFDRQGNKQIITTQLDSFHIVEQLEDVSSGISSITINHTSTNYPQDAALYFHLKLPAGVYANGSLLVTHPQENTLPSYNLSAKEMDATINATDLKLNSANQQLLISFNESTTVFVKKNTTTNDAFIHVYIPLKSDQNTFTLTASGTIDKTPATVIIDPSKQGRIFAGFGGNFRLQNQKNDPPVIDYCLSNMRVAYGRVEMPWRLWQPDENSNPIDSAKAGKLHAHVKESMEMAQRLSKMNIPVILSAWFPPQWAVTGKLQLRKQPDEEWGNPLNQEKAQAIYKSIADYIQYLKDAYNVEVRLFSFNESDLGINVRQTGEEHAKLIKELGAYFQLRGLQTKMLLGDNSDANTIAFIYPAMKDVATHPYIGAVSFHSWRGWEDTTLQKWANAATQLHLPLIVGEGSIDAAAWAYPKIFREQTYALQEINLYVRLLNICQPLSILQWQLTSDYSPLKGGGMFGDNSPLEPTQRFWNLKQLASIPPDVAAIPVKVDNENITCAAQADVNKHIYVIHLVNNGAARMITIKGLPSSVKKLLLHITSKEKNMQEEKPLAVTQGQVTFLLDAVSYGTVESN